MTQIGRFVTLKSLSAMIGTLSSGCVAALTGNYVVYHPQVLDIPLIHEAGDFRLDIGTSVFMSEGTVSLGITNHVALQGALASNFIDRRYVQGALGYYRVSPGGAVFEVYSGLAKGRGNVKQNAGSSYGSILEGSYTQPFVQFNVGSRHPGPVHIGLGIKLGYQDCLQETYWNYTGPGAPPSPQVEQIESILFEPGLFLGLGRGHPKLKIKVSGLELIKIESAGKSVKTHPLNLGLSLNLGTDLYR
jgi:hypothetical protein